MNLKQSIENFLRAQTESAPTVIKSKDNHILVIISFILALAVVIILLFKGIPKSEVILNQEVTPLTQNTDSLLAVRTLTLQLNDKITTLNEKVKKQEHKIQVLGTLLNENVGVLRNGHSVSQLISITRNWGFAGLPTHLTLTEKEKERYLILGQGLPEEGGNTSLSVEEIEEIPKTTDETVKDTSRLRR